MKNNKGFSLIELLAVLTIMALLGVITLQVIDGVNKKNKEQAEEVQIDSILTSAISYVPTSDITLPDIEWAGTCPTGQTNVVNYPIPASASDTNKCMVKVFLKVFTEECVMNEKIKNPRSGKCIKMDTSYVTIRYATSLSSIPESERKIGKFDGPYFYQYFEEVAACD